MSLRSLRKLSYSLWDLVHEVTESQGHQNAQEDYVVVHPPHLVELVDLHTLNVDTVTLSHHSRCSGEVWHWSLLAACLKPREDGAYGGGLHSLHDGLLWLLHDAFELLGSRGSEGQILLKAL
eukprot:TRINITY_DN1709_c0_g1_i1.p1 TRINITY_DN1709_c0_g1~~TRINITY_DN1709_c0_g1_i1.p1  ORF type:complete len:122 (+),score=7.27 TRINITY_DN1709_c0_g1_i1:256-621(+)